MIELFDAGRLLPRRDHSLLIAAGATALGLAALGGHGWSLQRELQSLQNESRQQNTELQRLKAGESAPTAALLTDLEQLAGRLEAEVAGAHGGSGVSPTPSQWLERLDAMGSPDVALNRVEIDRAGAARIEGVARSPQAMSRYVQSWEGSNVPAPMRARAIEVRQDDKAAPLLRFQLRANLPEPAAP